MDAIALSRVVSRKRDLLGGACRRRLAQAAKLIAH
jgi:hypothetical protein